MVTVRTGVEDSAMTSFGSLRSAAARSLGRFLADRRGTTAIEYGLIVTLIAVAIMSTVFAMGEGIKTTLYGTISNALASM
jgi:pilus assembly protein Flp/PilA